MRNGIPQRLWAGVLLLLSLQASADDWTFQLEPYLLASSIEGDVGLGRVTGASVDVDMNDILEVLDIGAMVHFEALRDSGLGFAIDYGFMDLSADISGPRGGVVDASVRQGVLEALLVNRTASGSGHVDYLIGLRWWDNDVDVTIDPAILPGTASADIERDWLDLVVGARWIHTVDDRWTFIARGDVGGFGLESDFTASLSTGFHFRMTESMILDVQYKATWVDYEDGSAGQPGYFAYDTVTHGPLIGLVFDF